MDNEYSVPQTEGGVPSERYPLGITRFFFVWWLFPKSPIHFEIQDLRYHAFAYSPRASDRVSLQGSIISHPLIDPVRA